MNVPEIDCTELKLKELVRLKGVWDDHEGKIAQSHEMLHTTPSLQRKFATISFRTILIPRSESRLR